MSRAVPILMLVPALLVAGTVSSFVDLDPSDLHFGSYEGYDVVELPGGFLLPEAGRPALPMMAATVAVPAGARVTSVEVVPRRTEELEGRYEIVPVQPPRVLSDRTEPHFVGPDAATYSSPAPFPARVTGDHVEGNAGGFRLAAVTFAPLQYLPAEGRLLLHTRLEVRVSYDDGARPERRLTPGQRDRTLVGLERLVANPGDLKRFAPGTGVCDQPVIDYLVVTNEALAPEFDDLLEYRQERGLRTALRTKEWVVRNYPGRDTPEKIRNMIIDYFQNRGLSYVLLAGDTAVVPVRRIRVRVGNETGDIPTDLYYGDLDYSWDSNGNNLFGEMSYDSVDMYADVFVGRASVDNAAQAQNFISKVRTYEGNPATDYIKRALLPGGWLWESIGYHGRIVNDSIADVTPSGWADIDLENPPNDAWVVADSFDHGFAIFDPAGHGWDQGISGEDGTSIYTTTQARQQTNDRRFSIMTSLACTPGNLETEDCLAEVAMNCAGGGCIGVMMNSRYGWGTPPSMGPSEKVCVRFFDHLLNWEEFLMGPCHDRSRETYASGARFDALWRWCYTQFNLFGDPALDIWTEAPEALAVSCADTVGTGGQTLDVTASTGDAPVQDALVCVWKGDEVYATGTTNASGVASIAIRPASTGTMRVTVTCHNCLPGQRDVTVVDGAPEPFIAFVRGEVDDSGSAMANGILEPGETVGLTLVVENTGAADATGATVVLRPLSGNVSVTDSTGDFGTIAAGDTGRAGGLTVGAEPDAYPGSTAEFVALVTAGSGEWELVVPLELGYPGRVAAELDTGECALSVTALGSIGFDRAGDSQGRGFRYPKHDTSSLHAASFAFGSSADYLVDRFYGIGGMDTEWQIDDSVRAIAPLWNSDQTLLARFRDGGHADARDVVVYQRGLGLAGEEFAVLVYDVVNEGDEAITGAYAGVLADFDVTAADKFRDVAYTDDAERTGFMRNFVSSDRYCGVNLLYPDDLDHHLRCLDHRLYVYPDSGLSEDMKYRLLKGELGVTASSTPYNWSVAVSAGPFDLAPNGGRQRLAFGLVAAQDSAGYLSNCAASRQWFSDNVGMLGPALPAVPERALFTARPNPFGRTLTIRFGKPVSGTVRVQAFDASGRLAAVVHSGTVPDGQALTWNPKGLAAGVYLLRVSAEGRDTYTRVALVR